MTTAKKEDGKVKSEKESRVETPVEEKKATAKKAPAKKAEAKKPEPKRVTLESVEAKLFDLSAEVDLLTKARAKAGRPNRQLMVLKRRLDTMIVIYSKFQKRSVN